MSVAYTQVHFRLDFFMEANTMNPDQGSSLIWVHIVCNIGYRLPKNINRQEEQTTKLVTCRKNVYFKLELKGIYFCKFVSHFYFIFEPVHEISNNVVCGTSKASDQPAHTRSLIRAFACH